MCGIHRAIVRSLKKWIKSRKASRSTSSQDPSPPTASTYPPCDVFLYMSNFLHFKDYRNLIEAFWPNGGEDELIRQRLWKLSTRTYSTSVFKGKHLQVEYNYDDGRPEEDRILLNVKTLLPVTGPIFTKGWEDLWMNPSEIVDVVRRRYFVNKCTDYSHLECNCWADKFRMPYPQLFPLFYESPHGDYHDICMKFIFLWLQNYLDLYMTTR
ncbi:repeat element protein-a2.1 [Ichnoviriform fugitivi]|uniref:Repeat element protein-a2.1 n=1 Tax=Ichnoviriform fugitivi TaxID=265522 RepID=A2Q0C9_9VIRU|nr:repeat element protein-a2.1 [Ichnoviriform fugitivi]BAF45644.1 repeat element protein-a2.1 [Ichnoviriform fugitivi]